MICDDCIHADICINSTQGNCSDYLSQKIRWTDKLFVIPNGDIVDFDGRVVGHINLADMREVKKND